MPDRFLQPEPLARLIEAQRPTIAAAVPTIWGNLLRYLREHGGDLSSFRRVICGGSAVPLALMKAFFEEFGVEIKQAWGMTETSPVGSVATPPIGVVGDEIWRYRASQGRLVAGVEGRIVADGDIVLPRDGAAVGEIEVRGPSVTARYYRDADGASVTSSDSRVHRRGSLPTSQLTDNWSFITEIPKTSVGKFDKTLIRRRYAKLHLPRYGDISGE